LGARESTASQRRVVDSTVAATMIYTTFLSGLPDSISSSDLRSWLDEDGLAYVRAVSVYGRHCGFIDCATEEDRNAIIHRYHGARIEDREQGGMRTLRAEPARPRPQRSEARR
jgi:hypothetical protein